MMEIEPENYIILTPTIPCTNYELQGGHTLRTVKTSKRMFDGYGTIIPHSYRAVMALTHLGAQSDSIWKDLVMFHSFLCDDPETYDYAERSWRKLYPDSELNFVHNQDYFYEKVYLGNKRHRKTLKRKRINAIDFNHFPIEVYPTVKETFEKESTSPANENLTLTESLSNAEELKPEYKEQVKYKEAFQLFCNLRSLDKNLYDQIRLYVFAGNVREFREVYRNDNAPVAFYISILESQAGDPPTCFNELHCDICGRDVKTHGTPIEKHFIDRYGTSFMSLRGIRHKFFHRGAYFSISENLWDIYDRRQDTDSVVNDPRLAQELDHQEESLADFEDEVQRLQKIARKTLIESFVRYYKDPSSHSYD